MRANEFTRETINPDILNRNFKHTQPIGDYTYTARYDTIRSYNSDIKKYLVITCLHDNKRIGYTWFEIISNENGDSWLESGSTKVSANYRRNGIASTMYAYAKMLGNTIKPSKDQEIPGKKMWAVWRKTGDAKHLMTP